MIEARGQCLHGPSRAKGHDNRQQFSQIKHSRSFLSRAVTKCIGPKIGFDQVTSRWAAAAADGAAARRISICGGSEMMSFIVVAVVMGSQARRSRHRVYFRDHVPCPTLNV